MKIKTLTKLSILLFSNYTFAQTDYIFKAGFEFVSRLNDTGITWAGEYPSGNNVDCTSTTISAPQDCNHGRDFTHNDPTDGHAGFSFTKLDANGVPLADQSVDYAITPWSCVKDNVTGLIWEVKNEIANDIHHKDNIYKWGGITAIGLGHKEAQGTYYNDWDVLVNSSNTQMLCGYSNWRVPTVAELSSIINKGTFFPAIDVNYFPNTTSTRFWSSSPTVGYPSSPSSAWYIYSGKGDVYSGFRDEYGRVRLVRSFGQ